MKVLQSHLQAMSSENDTNSTATVSGYDKSHKTAHVMCERAGLAMEQNKSQWACYNSVAIFWKSSEVVANQSERRSSSTVEQQTKVMLQFHI